jgi:RluA family pseudouridine synthase
LKFGDVVEITPDTSRASVSGQNKQFSIRYVIAAEDNEYIIVNKPVGLLVNAHKNSLENILQKDLNNPQIRAAHRLDRDTSGAVIFAKNQNAFAEIVKVFQKFGVEKYYRGIAQGDLLKKFPAKFTLHQPIDGQSAETRVRVLQSNNLASYFEAQIITGRKHQIRAHLAQAGFPLLGENIYQTAAVKNAVYRQIPRQMLHAAAVRFTNPCSGKILQAAVPEPPDFQDTLRALQL